jgi:leader peptidase (prepilin peptidase)/N-methyltransferase
LTVELILIVPFLFGAVVGSFLNVCIYRLPLGISVVSPPSSCPECKGRIPFYYNVPIISYIVLGGRCGSCGAPFSLRYPFVEALTGLVALVLFVRFGLTPELFIYFAFVSALIVITFVDLSHGIIPDVISLPGVLAGFGASFILTAPGWLHSIIGIALGGGILLAIAGGYYLITGREGMGIGDVKLLAMIGAFLGWRGVLVTILAGSLVGSVIGIFFMLAYGKGSKFALPFGPFLALGAIVYLFYGEELLHWYIMRAVGGL